MKKKIKYSAKSQRPIGKGQANPIVKERKIKYAVEEIGDIEIVKDFLPNPEDIILLERTVKVTLNLSRSSVDFFKNIAQKHGSQYQKVIRNLLDSYTSHYSE